MVTPNAHSCRFVFPRLTAPAAKSLAATAESAVGTFAAKSFEPAVVATPATSNRSFNAMGAPASVVGAPLLSMARARCRAPCAVTVMNAFSSGSRRSIRASAASVSSSAPIVRACRVAIASSSDPSSNASFT